MSSNNDAIKTVDISGRTCGNPRVLIVRLSAVGDCLQTMPLACAVRAHCPDAHITWVVERGAAPLVEANEAVDRMIVLPKRFATSPRLMWRLRQTLRAEKFDLSFDPQGLTKSGLIAWLSGARRRIGFTRPAAREINPWLQTELVVSRAAHRVDRYLELLEPLVLGRPPVRFGLRVPVAAQQIASELANRPELRSGFAVLNPGAGWHSKLWPLDRYAEVARHLERSGTRAVVVFGGAQEQEWAKQIVADSQGEAILAPSTSLLELAAILQRARIFVGSDTGPLHLAAAVGTPCVALFGASSAAACGPYGTYHIILQRSCDESAGRKRPGADNWAMRQISANYVNSACDKLLIGERPRSAAA